MMNSITNIKTLITIFSFALSFTSSFAQERLTTILTENTNTFYFVEVIDDIRYLVEIDQNDNLNVNIIDEDYSLTPMHSKMLKRIFDENYYKVVGSKIYTFDDRVPVIYNYVEDTEVRVDIPSDWVPQYWTSINESSALVRVSDTVNAEWKYFLVDNEGEVLSEDISLKDILNIYSNYYFKRSMYDPSVNSSYYLENIETGFKDTLMHEIEKQISTFYNDELIYIDEEDSFYRFNLLDGTKTQIPNVSFYAGEVWSIKVIDDMLFVQNREANWRFVIYMYSLETGAFIQSFEHDEIDNFNLQESYIAQNKLIVLDQYDLGVFDLDSGEGYTYPTNYNYNLRAPLMYDRYIFNSNSFEKSYVDLKNGTKTYIENADDLKPYDRVDVVPMNDSYLGVFSSVGSTLKSVFKLDVHNNSLQHLSDIDDSNEGMNNFASEVLKFGENMILVTDDIYSVDGTEVTKINPHDLVEVNYKKYEVHEDHITFVGQDVMEGQYIYSYDGNILTEEAFIPNTNPFPFMEAPVYEYAVTKDFVFYIKWSLDNAKLFKYEKENSTITELGNPDWFFFDIDLFQSGNDVYFDHQDSIYYVDNDGNVSFMLSNKNEETNKTGLFENNGNCYNVSASEISILKSNSPKPLLSGEFELGYISSSLKRSESIVLKMFTTDNINKVIYIENEFAQQFEFEYYVTSIIQAENNHYIIFTQNNAINDKRLYILNGNERELFNVTDLITENNYYNLIFKSGVPHFIKYNYTAKIATIYKLDKNFTDPIQVFTTSYYGGSAISNFLDIGESGMLYMNAYIGIVNDDFSAQKLNLRGDWRMTEMILNEEGFVYFLAGDAQYGNQLFRYDLSDFILGNSEVNIESTFKVYPNPFQDFIVLDEPYNGLEYQILNAEGKKIKTGEVKSNGIRLNQLPTGFYYLKIDNGTSVYSTPIFKR